MLDAIRNFFEASAPQEITVTRRLHAVHLATAVLLVEVARADDRLGEDEQGHIIDLLRDHLELTDAEGEELVELAHAEANESVSLQGFTRAIHEHLDDEQKLSVVELLWRVALLDGDLHRFEDHLVRKIAELLYVRNADLIRIRNQVRGQTPG